MSNGVPQYIWELRKTGKRRKIGSVGTRTSLHRSGLKMEMEDLNPQHGIQAMMQMVSIRKRV